MIRLIDPKLEATLRARLDGLAKPPGSLTLLEELALWLGLAQGRERPQVRQPRVIVFAADHGVAMKPSASPVSAYPSSVTALMVKTFTEGRAAVSVLAREAGASLEVVDVGVHQPIPDLKSSPQITLTLVQIAQGSADLELHPAMTQAQLERAMEAGAQAVDRAFADGVDLLALGEMGIGNTTSASALVAALLDVDPARVTGAGAGLDAAQITHKAATIARALKRASPSPDDPLGCMAQLGGLELAALMGAMLQAARLGIPVLLDGFIVGAAALCAARHEPGVRHYLYPATRSAEPGHRLVLDALDLGRPVFDAGFRLGEASAAALAIPVARSACALLEQMATLQEVLS